MWFDKSAFVELLPPKTYMLPLGIAIAECICLLSVKGANIFHLSEFGQYSSLKDGLPAASSPPIA